MMPQPLSCLCHVCQTRGWLVGREVKCGHQEHLQAHEVGAGAGAGSG